MDRQILIRWIGISRSKFYDWQKRYGQVNEHNHWIPRDFWLQKCEKEAIVNYFLDHPGQGYRRLTYMMLDADIVAVSPSSTYRVLSQAGLLKRWNDCRTSSKGAGFQQPPKPHAHWHVDMSYINVAGTFYYLCTVLDGYSRFIVHWEIREAMTEADVEIVLQRAKEAFPDVHPQVISDNGPAFIARDFKAFIRMCGMTHVRTSPYYPQSNGKLERWHQSLKRECLRPKAPLTLDDTRRLVGGYVHQYNTERLHSAIGYITPLDKLQGRAERIFAERDAKLARARDARRCHRKVG